MKWRKTISVVLFFFFLCLTGYEVFNKLLPEKDGGKAPVRFMSGLGAAETAHPAAPQPPQVDYQDLLKTGDTVH